ncbi:MAG: glycosyltransferase family 2 protein [Pseudomonadota bacterium]
MAPTPKDDPFSATLVSCMRNEGQFILEWLAYHRTLGFEDIVAFTNDCTDGSDLLLAELDRLGYVTHVDHTPPPGMSPQLAAMKIAFEHPKVRATNWTMHIDADEFVNIQIGNRQIADLLAHVQPADIVALLWRPFGNAGLKRWHGGSVLQSFTQAQDRPKRRTVHHKSIWRVGMFGRAIDHMPKDPLVDTFVLKNTRGEEIDGHIVHHPRKCPYKAQFRHLTFANAYINHYAVKSDDILLMKNDRGDGHAGIHDRYHLGSQYHNKYNRNEAEDTSILDHWSQIEANIWDMRSHPRVAELELSCRDWFVKRREAVLTPKQIAAWTVQPEVQAEP